MSTPQRPLLTTVAKVKPPAPSIYVRKHVTHQSLPSFLHGVCLFPYCLSPPSPMSKFARSSPVQPQGLEESWTYSRCSIKIPGTKVLGRVQFPLPKFVHTLICLILTEEPHPWSRLHGPYCTNEETGSQRLSDCPRAEGLAAVELGVRRNPTPTSEGICCASHSPDEETG